jgi:hypothetical protein
MSAHPLELGLPYLLAPSRDYRDFKDVRMHVGIFVVDIQYSTRTLLNYVLS